MPFCPITATTVYNEEMINKLFFSVLFSSTLETPVAEETSRSSKDSSNSIASKDD
jgi:hypothetical protein